MQLVHHLWPWEAQTILWLQSQSESFISAMRWVSELGHPPAMLAMILIGYWGWKEDLGIRLAKFLTLCGAVMSLSKDFILAPRPFWIHPDIESLGSAGGFGMPSGHAMMACVWLIWMGAVKHWNWKTGCLAVVLATGLSRVTLGLHSVLQVTVGWILGSLICLWVLKISRMDPPEDSRPSLALKWEMITVLGLLLLAWPVYESASDWQAPTAWAEMAALHSDGQANIRLPTPRGLILYLALYAGLSLSYCLRRMWHPKLNLAGTWKQRTTRVFLGGWLSVGAYYLYRSWKQQADTDAGSTPWTILLIACLAASYLLVLGFPLLFDKLGWCDKRSASTSS